MKYVCPICGYVYDEEKEGVPFSQLPDGWVCPLCGAVKSTFTVVAPKTAPASVKVTEEIYTDIKNLSPGELSAVFSNLARGCEKQYQSEAMELYTKLANYFANHTPDVPDGSIEQLSALIKSNLENEYPAARAAATADGDRGTLRICTWGEKVTAILSSLIQRYEAEGEEFLKNTGVWVCTVCGFIYIGDKAPELCPVCKVPSWKFEKIEGGVSA